MIQKVNILLPKEGPCNSSHKVFVLDDGRSWSTFLQSLRYIKNNFSDGYRQDSIDLVLGHYKVDIYSGPNGKKSKSLIFYLPLILMMTLSFLLLTTLIFSESNSEFVLLLICIISTAMFLALMMLRHSRVYIDLPKYCAFELVDTLKLN